MNTIQRGHSGPQVKQLQLSLNQRLDPSPMLLVDGEFGELTEKALRDFQLLHHLTVDGRADPGSLAALGITERPIHSPSPDSVTAEAPWLTVARAELGVSERLAPGQHNPRIVEYHSTTSLRASDDETPWCSSFVNWVLVHAGCAGTGSARARDWLAWGSELHVARPGAVTVLHRKIAGGRDGSTGSSSGFHVAFLISASPHQVRLLGGNQSNQVRYSNFSLAGYEVSGYRWPAIATTR